MKKIILVTGATKECGIYQYADSVYEILKTSKNYEFPALYSQSKQALDSVNRINMINYITSIKGRNLVLSDFYFFILK